MALISILVVVAMSRECQWGSRGVEMQGLLSPREGHCLVRAYISKWCHGAILELLGTQGFVGPSISPVSGAMPSQGLQADVCVCLRACEGQGVFLCLGLSAKKCG